MKVDQNACVLREDGTPIPNLYAGGGVAAGISGHGAAGYLAGIGLLAALGYGMLAGRHAARAIREAQFVKFVLLVPAYRSRCLYRKACLYQWKVAPGGGERNPWE